MKLTRRQLRHLLIKEMSDMGEPMVPSVSEENVAKLSQFMRLFDRHMKEMTRFHRKPYFNDRKRTGMKIPYQMLRDQMGTGEMDPEVIKQSLLAISDGIMRSYKSRKTDQLISMARQIARYL